MNRPSPRSAVTVGAYDRFNYGDLLFPLVLDHAAGERGEALLHVSVHGVDMSSAGGIATQAIHELGDGSARPPAIILGGGEILGATWGPAAAHLLPGPLDLALLGVGKYISRPLFDAIGKFYCRGSWPTPYVPSVAVSREIPIVANAIGASSLSLLRPGVRDEVTGALANASFLSVRDRTGQGLLARAGLSAELAPDSVAILNRFLPATTPSSERVLTFQASRAWLRSRRPAAVKALTELARAFDRIQFLPLGLAGGHADDVGLVALRHELSESGVSNTRIDVPRTVGEIASAISASTVFVGSSLHGNITAMAYGVPSVGLEGIGKLDAYIETWGENLTPRGVPLSELRAALDWALAYSDALADRAERLDRLSWANTQRVLDAAQVGAIS